MRSHPGSGVVRVAVGLAVVAATTALTAATTATAATDLPDTYTAATHAAVSPNSTALRSTIDSRTDQDWFKFSVTRATKAAVTLGSLPGNYSLAVYDGTGRRIALSAYTGTHFERVITSVAPGTYYVRVATQGDYSRTKAYLLRFRPLPAGLVTLDQRMGTEMTNHRVVATIFNNTNTWQWLADVPYAWYDKNHRLLRRDTGGMSSATWVIPPYSAAPFGWGGRKPPAGAVSVTVSPRGERVRPPGSLPAITVSGVRATFHPDRYTPYTDFTATARWSGSPNVWGEVLCEVYSANGALMDFEGMSMFLDRRHTEQVVCSAAAIGRPNTHHLFGRADVVQPVPWE
jgi:hypothetical protein